MPGLANYVAAVMADTPRAFYKMQDTSGNPQDSSGNGLHITTTTGSPNYASGLGPFTSWRCIGCGPSVGFSRAAVQTQTDNFTMEMWMDLNSISGNGKIPLGTFGSGQAIGIDTDRKIFGSAFGVGVLADAAAALPSAGTWTHIVVLRRSGTWEYYLNGAVDTANAGTTAPSGTPTTTQIHNQSQITCNYAMVAIYNTALSSARIAAHYAAAGNGLGTSFVPKTVVIS